jgi:hypothetical protein
MTDAGDIFWVYSDEFERAASEKYDRTARQQYEVLDVDKDDL